MNASVLNKSLNYLISNYELIVKSATYINNYLVNKRLTGKRRLWNRNLSLEISSTDDVRLLKFYSTFFDYHYLTPILMKKLLINGADVNVNINDIFDPKLLKVTLLYRFEKRILLDDNNELNIIVKQYCNDVEYSKELVLIINEFQSNRHKHLKKWYKSFVTDIDVDSFYGIKKAINDDCYYLALALFRNTYCTQQQLRELLDLKYSKLMKYIMNEMDIDPQDYQMIRFRELCNKRVNKLDFYEYIRLL